MNKAEAKTVRRKFKGGWIGVDLDGTLARYDGWQGELHIGEPIELMAMRVRYWLECGVEVRIFTARIATGSLEGRMAIERWCIEHLGRVLPITATKDFAMVELYDDRAWRVESNTGRISGQGYQEHAAQE